MPFNTRAQSGLMLQPRYLQRAKQHVGEEDAYVKEIGKPGRKGTPP